MSESRPTPEELRAEGYHVFFTHYRVPDGVKNRHSRHCKYLYPYRSGREPWVPSPLGGKTVCVVLDPHRHLVCRGVTFCRSNENFVKRLGRKYAFDYAMEQWPQR